MHPTLAQLGASLRIMRHASRLLPQSSWSSSRLLAMRASETPEHIGIAFEKQRLSWRELDARVNRVAHVLQRHGIGPGDAVAILMDNRPEFVVALTALNRLRAIGALINTNVTGRALVHAISVAKSRAVIVGAEHADKLSEVLPELEGISAEDVLLQPDGLEGASNDSLDALAEAMPDTPPRVSGQGRADEPMAYIYTSGTTGLPKAAIISNQRWLLASLMFGRGIFEATPRDVIYVPLPLYHSNAMFAGWGASLNTGARMALRRRFSASAFWNDVRAFRATCVIYIGELCRYLMNQPERPDDGDHSLRVISGNGLRPDIWERFQKRFRIPLIREFYGATEGNAPMVNLVGRVGMVGRLAPGQIIVRCDPETGEVIRTPEGRCSEVQTGESGLLLGRINRLTRFDGYVDRAASDRKVIRDVLREGDRFFNTGDLLVLHPDRWVSFGDRVGDTFRWKGENVSTNEVAEILNDAPGVLETNVYGVRVPGADGRAGMASVVCTDGFSLEDFAAHVRAELPVYQRPYFLRLQKDMRITGTFKHQKVDYREEGYDPARVGDPLHFFDGDRYVPLDAALHARIQSGEVTLR
jgi:acyl-CoA synthetase (AMP-forming)/AMP-acid ligase II